MSSRISGFYKMPVEKRKETIKNLANLSGQEIKTLCESFLDISLADKMIENVIGTMEIPLGIATNFIINGKEVLIPMAVEESSVVAACSNAAKMARKKGGFTTTSSEPIMIGQIQVLGINDYENAKDEILKNKEEILKIANMQDSVLVNLGGGAKDLEVRILKGMLIVHLLVDVRDAMGANAVNTMAEAIAPHISKITKGKIGLKILSNLADKRIAKAKVVYDKDEIGGEDVVNGIISAYKFAMRDPYRAATHNKGIMNGIDAVLIATSNDWRAIESGAHSYASRNGYKSLTHWKKDEDGNLAGEIELPMAVGIVGGASSIHPKAKINKKILGIKSAKEFGEILAAVGLAQNFAAIRALAVEGIQKGHMSLHAKNIAIMAGAKDDEIDKISEKLINEGKVNIERAKEILEELR